MAAQAALPTPTIFTPAGVDVTKVTSTPLHALGSIARGAYGQTYVYCVSSGSHALGALVAVDEAFVSRSATTAIANTLIR